MDDHIHDKCAKERRVYGWRALCGHAAAGYAHLNPWLRALLLITVSWVPLALLCAIDGTLWGNRVDVPSLKDYATYARFWIALPVLMLVRPLSGYSADGCQLSHKQ